MSETSYAPVLWREAAACLGADPAIFFRKDTTTAERMCDACPVREPCLREALRRNDEWFQGGMTKLQRRRYRAVVGRT